MDEKPRYETEALVAKIKDGTIQASDLDKVFYSIQNSAAEQALRMLPNAVDYLVKQSAHIKKLSENFFRDNKELVDKKDLVSKLLERVEADNPGMAYERMLDKVASLAKTAVSDRQTVDISKKFKISELDSSLGDL